MLTINGRIREVFKKYNPRYDNDFGVSHIKASLTGCMKIVFDIPSNTPLI